MRETASRISPLLPRPIFSSQRRVAVNYPVFVMKTRELTLTPADLVTYCEREKIPYTIFEDWSSILSTTMDIYKGRTTVQEVAAARKET